MVLATPLLSALRLKFPGSHIAFMGTPAGSAVLSGHPDLSEVIVYDKRGSEKGLGGMKKKADELRSRYFDIVLCAHRSVRTAVLLALAGIPRRIGFATSAFPWLFHELAPRPPLMHEVERNLRLLDPLGGPPSGYEPELSLPAAQKPDGETLGDKTGPLVGLCPGSVWPTKRWHARGFAQVADLLAEKHGANICLIGAESDTQAASEVETLMKARPVNLAGKTSLAQWIGLISAMDLVVTNDSSPTHVASAVKVPVVTVFGPTTREQGFAPWNGNSRVIEVPGLACRPCGEHGAKRCPEGHFKCMELLESGQVFEAARAALGEE